MTGPVVATTEFTAAVVKSTDDRLAGLFSARTSEGPPCHQHARAATDLRLAGQRAAYSRAPAQRLKQSRSRGCPFGDDSWPPPAAGLPAKCLQLPRVQLLRAPRRVRSSRLRRLRACRQDARDWRIGGELAASRSSLQMSALRRGCRQWVDHIPICDAGVSAHVRMVSPGSARRGFRPCIGGGRSCLTRDGRRSGKEAVSTLTQVLPPRVLSGPWVRRNSGWLAGG